jgi:multidrug efflux pump subunit AcrA (membrane-fusion protein)
MKTKLFFVFGLFLLLTSCIQQNKTDEPVDKRQFLREANQIDVQVLSKSTFTKEIISNGKLKSIRKSDLQFKLSEVITDIKVKNGSWVKQRQILATLENDELQRTYEQAKIKLEQAKLELEDFFLSHAQLMADTTSEEGKQKLRIA